MALWDKADLLQRLKDLLRRPLNDELDDNVFYRAMTDAQAHWMRVFAAIAPEENYGNPTLLTTADNGATYTFGTDADVGGNIYPMGHVELRASRDGRPLIPGAEWDMMADFVFDGALIRFPGGRTKTFSNGPYARFVKPSGLIDASTEPVLKPPHSRILIVTVAAELIATAEKEDPTPYKMLTKRFLFGDPESGDEGIMGYLRTRYNFQGAMALDTSGDGSWWKYIDTGAGYTKWVG